MIKATTKRVWEMYDPSKPKGQSVVEVQPGTYELERVPNPYGLKIPWLVIKGTTIGWAEDYWKGWINGQLANDPEHPDFGKPIDWGDAEIVLEEDGQLVPPPQD